VVKKKILYHSDFSLSKTGFGKTARTILTYLYNTGKYDIVHYSCGVPKNHIELQRTPWKSVGTLPDDSQVLENLQKDPNALRMASYGFNHIDEIIKNEKPDFYIGVQDIWGVDYSISKPWFKKINSVIWTTLDSLPILDSAIKYAPKIKNYWIWSDFATKALNDMGHKHVKTMHGPVDVSNFFRLSDKKRSDLRERFNINKNKFIIGFVFRNQLRKSAPNLIEGYAIWKNKNNIKNSALLLHTHFGEGWNIMKLAKEYNIDSKEIYTTYICKKCKNYEVKPFEGEGLDCPFCNEKKSQFTTSVNLGVSENHLNEIYNLMDVYCHPFTSGGQEIPIQEAKLTELITLVTNYSCGEAMCAPEACSLTLDWSEYREHGTEFIKASTNPQSIAQQLKVVYEMDLNKKNEMGAKAREWTIKNYSVKSIGEKIESFLESNPRVDYKFDFEEEKKDPFTIIPDIADDKEWLKYLYAKILKRPEVDEDDDGHKYWIEQISKGVKREAIEKYFRDVAFKENESLGKKFEDLLFEHDKGKRILYVMPEDANNVFLSSSIFESIKNTYTDHTLYVATKKEYTSILDGNPFVDKVLPYIPQMDSLPWLEGAGHHEGYFEIAFVPHLNLINQKDFIHNGKTKIEYNICTL
jgi:hypothetical protein